MTQDDIIKNPSDYDLSIETVGKGTLKSPMNGVPFVSENDKVSLTTDVNLISEYLPRAFRYLHSKWPALDRQFSMTPLGRAQVS